MSQGSVLGRTTIPPPGTGEAIAGGAAAPYYQTPPSAQGPPAASTAPPYEPPGGYDNLTSPPDSQGAMMPADGNGLRWVTSQDSGADGSSRNHGAGRMAGSADALASTGSVPREAPVVGRLRIGSRPHDYDSQAAQPSEAEFAQRTESTALRIVEPAREAEDVAGTVRLASGSGVQSADAWREREGTTANAHTAAHTEYASDSPGEAMSAPDGDTPRRASVSRRTGGGGQGNRPAPYGHDPKYTWLKGQLQRTEDNRQWMLRYVPPGRTGDAYGGTVALPDSAVMAGYTAGDFVAVQGQLLADNGAGGEYPGYDIQRIKPLGRF